MVRLVLSAASDRWFLKNINSVRSPLSNGLLTAFTKLGDHQKKNWRENNDNEVKSSVFTSIELRVVFSHRVSSKAIIYLNTE